MRALAVMLVCAALSACGSDDTESDPSAETVQGSERGVLATIDALQTASRRGAGGRICRDVFTRDLVRSIETSAKRSCSTEVRKRLFTRKASISVQRGIQVKGITASAIIREQNGNISTLHFLKQAGRWRIDRVTPQKAGHQ